MQNNAKRKLVKCQRCNGTGAIVTRFDCVQCDGDGFVYADTVQTPKLKLLTSSVSTQQAPPPPPPAPEVEIISEAESLAAQRYNMMVWKQRIEREIARLDEQLLGAMEESELNKVYADNGFGYVRARKWAMVEDSPYTLRMIEMKKES